MTIVSIADLRRAARQRLPKAVFDFIDGGADDESTLRRNASDFESIRFRPRVLVDVSRRDLSLPILGRHADFPLIISPTGLSALASPKADAALARVADANRIPITLSCNASARIEDFARAAPDARRWFQLYVYKDLDLVKDLVNRALAADYEALVLTVDIPVLGQRERDVHNGFKVPLRPTPRLIYDLIRCPRWTLGIVRNGVPRIENFVAAGSSAKAASTIIKLINSKMDSSLNWDSASWLRELWPRKLIIKGIVTPEDATEAVNRGFDAVAISNHGGRQLDGSPSAIAALPAIAAAIGDRAEIYVDGGIRRGANIAKALALGARAVMAGRPTLYGAAAGGEAGAAKAVSILREEFDRCLALIGCPEARALNPAFVDSTGLRDR